MAEAEHLASLLGEPLGTLVLTLAIVTIEVALIAAVMLGAQAAPTLGRDTMFAVLMIVLNGVVGLALLLGGLRHREQAYNLQGAAAYLSIIIPLSAIALVLPSYTVSTPDRTMSTIQATSFGAVHRAALRRLPRGADRPASPFLRRAHRLGHGG